MKCTENIVKKFSTFSGQSQNKKMFGLENV